MPSFLDKINDLNLVFRQFRNEFLFSGTAFDTKPNSFAQKEIHEKLLLLQKIL